MRSAALLWMLCSLVALGCERDLTAQPPWIAELMPQLHCGMTLEEIHALADKKVTDLGAGHPFLGTHRISTHWHDLWFRFDGDGLQAVTWGVAEDSKTTRLSPRHDLCVDDLAFLLRISWTEVFVGSDIYLDGELVAEKARVPPLLELAGGMHELRIEQTGYQPIIRNLHLTSADRGDQSVTLVRDDLVPLDLR